MIPAFTKVDWMVWSARRVDTTARPCSARPSTATSRKFVIGPMRSWRPSAAGQVRAELRDRSANSVSSASVGSPSWARLDARLGRGGGDAAGKRRLGGSGWLGDADHGDRY